MKNFSTIVLAFIVGFGFGAAYDSMRLANDEEYHDYWMKRAKKPE